MYFLTALVLVCVDVIVMLSCIGHDLKPVALGGGKSEV